MERKRSATVRAGPLQPCQGSFSISTCEQSQDDSYVDPAGKVVGVVVVGQSTKMQSFNQSMYLTGNVPQIDRRANDQSIRIEDTVYHR